MKAAIFAYSRNGMKTAGRLMTLLGGNECDLFAPKRIAAAPFKPIPAASKDFYGDLFSRTDAIIFVGACGIAVRSIAPHLKSKLTDPAVICIDEQGQYVIPILSGHIGGANELAKQLASGLGAQAVITTATDINGKFSVDTWAAANGFIIDNMQRAKEISAAILEQDVALSAMLPVASKLPQGLILKESGPAGIFIGWEKRKPFEVTLNLIPQNLCLGIGCRKGTSAGSIRQAVSSVLDRYAIDQRSIKLAASIDLKAGEPGLLEFCRMMDIPLRCYSARELLSAEGPFSHSDFVQTVTGVDNVCERAAMMTADRLIVPKTIFEGVTVAIGAEIKEVHFE